MVSNNLTKRKNTQTRTSSLLTPNSTTQEVYELLSKIPEARCVSKSSRFYKRYMAYMQYYVTLMKSINRLVLPYQNL